MTVNEKRRSPQNADKKPNEYMGSCGEKAVRDAGVAGYGDRRIAIVRLDSFDFLTHGMAENLMPAPTQFGSSSLAIVEQFYRFPWPWQ
jgi:hypothetical protein